MEEDDASLTMSFQLDDSPPPEGIRMGHGVMKRFHGHWHIRPHPSDPDHASLSTLDQDLALGITLPSAFDGILKSISCNQVRSAAAAAAVAGRRRCPPGGGGTVCQPFSAVRAGGLRSHSSSAPTTD